MSFLVSIITPTYNSEKFINLTIESIISQTYNNWELLITDDCSSDNTLEIINYYAKLDNRIKVFRLLNNSGPAVARNLSISKANGRFIAFCDSDDQWKSDKLYKQLNFMLNSNVALSFTNYEVINENGEYLKLIRSPSKITHSQALQNNYIGCLTAIYDTINLGKVFMPNLRKRQDWALWLLILKKIPYGLGLNENLAIYRVRSNSISANKLKILKYNWRIYKEVENFSHIKSCNYMVKYMFFYINKKYFKVK